MLGRRAFISAALALLIPYRVALAEIFGGNGNEWDRDTVSVEIYADPRFVPLITARYAAIEGSHPQMPHFVMKPKTPKPCSKVKVSELNNGVIAWCSIPEEGGGTTLCEVANGEIRKCKVQVSDSDLASPGYAENTVCHEMMHSITNVNDCYGCAANSCVHGYLQMPGPYDFQLITKVYNGKRH